VKDATTFRRRGFEGVGRAKKRRGGKGKVTPRPFPGRGRELWKCEYDQCHALIIVPSFSLFRALIAPHVRDRARMRPQCTALPSTRVGDLMPPCTPERRYTATERCRSCVQRFDEAIRRADEQQVAPVDIRVECGIKS